MTAAQPQHEPDLSQLIGMFDAALGWSSGTRREQLLGMGLHLDLAAATGAQLVASAARHGRSDPARAAKDLGLAVTQMEVLAQTLRTFQVEALALAAEATRRRPVTDPDSSE